MSQSQDNPNRGPWADAVMLLTVSILVGTLWVVVPIPQAPAPVFPSLESEITIRRNQGDELEDSLDTLAGRLSIAEDRANMKQRELQALTEELARLAILLDQGEKLVARLQRELLDLEKPEETTVAGTPVAARSAKERVLFILTRNRVLVYGDDTYSETLTLSEDGWRITIATRKTAGETVAEASARGSDFRRALGDMDPTKQYVALIVFPDSFGTAFREIRELARARKLAVGWEPYVGEDGNLRFSEGGRDIEVQCAPACS